MFITMLAAFITAVVGNALKIEFLGFGEQDPHPFDIPKPMFIGLAYAVFISSGELLLYGTRRVLALRMPSYSV